MRKIFILINQYLMKLYINLTNFNDDKLAGVGFFMKRIFERLNNQDNFFKLFTHIYVYHPTGIDIKEILSIPVVDNIYYKKIKIINKNILFRIIFEQLFFPFIIKEKNTI